jgi:class 3 adenylate cyclase
VRPGCRLVGPGQGRIGRGYFGGGRKLRRGREVKSLGDGFLATFDGPARAIHCASAIRDSLHGLNVPVRIGVHTGEVELAENDVRGIAVHIASRVAHIGGTDDVLVSRTVKDLARIMRGRLANVA